MAQIGIEFKSDSFKSFNDQLERLQKFTTATDKKLKSLAKSVDNFMTVMGSPSAKSATTRLKSFPDRFNNLTNAIKRGPTDRQITRLNVLGSTLNNLMMNIAAASRVSSGTGAGNPIDRITETLRFSDLFTDINNIQGEIAHINDIMTGLTTFFNNFRYLSSTTIDAGRINRNLSAMGRVMRFVTTDGQAFVRSMRANPVDQIHRQFRAWFGRNRNSSILGLIQQAMGRGIRIDDFDTLTQGLSRIVRSIQTMSTLHISPDGLNKTLDAMTDVVEFLTRDLHIDAGSGGGSPMQRFTKYLGELSGGFRKGIERMFGGGTGGGLISLVSRNFSMADIQKFIDVIGGIDKLARSVTQMGVLNLVSAKDAMQNIQTFMNAMQDLFVNIGTGRRTLRAPIIGKLLSGFVNIFAPGRMTMGFQGIVGLSKQLQGIDIESFQKLTVAMRRIALALSTMGEVRFNQAQLAELQFAIQAITDMFIGRKASGGLLTFLGRIRSLGGGQAQMRFVGIVNMMQKISGVKFTNLETLSKGIAAFGEAIAAFTRIDANFEQVDNVALVIGRMTEIFTGKGGISRLTGTLRNLGRGNIFGGLNTLFGSGVLKKIGKVDATNIESFGKLASGITNLITSLATIQKIKLDPQQLKAAGSAISSFTREFTKSGLLRRDGILKRMEKFSPQTFQNFANFGRAIGNIVGSADKIRKLQGLRGIGKELQAFTKELIDAARKLNKQLLGDDFSKLEEFSRTIQRISKSFERNTSKELKAGLVQGMKGAGTEIADQTTEEADERWGIKSPSRVFMRIGRDLSSGLIKGFREVFQGISQIAKNVARIFGQFVNLDIVRNKLRMFGRMWSAMGQRANSVTQNLRQRFVITLGDLVNIAERFGRQFYNAFIGTGIEFETAFTGVLKTLDTSNIFAEGGQAAVDQFTEGLREGLKDLAASPDSLVSGLDNAFVRLSGIAESAGQLGIASENIIEFTDVVGQLAQATNLADEEASFFLARFGTLTDTTEFDRIGSAVVALGNNFATTEKEITELTERIVGSANAAGFTQPEILGWAAAMRAVGLEAESAGSNFSKLVGDVTSAVSEGGSQLNAFAEAAGMSSQAFTEAFREDASGAIQELIVGLGELNNEELYAFFGDAEIDSQRMRRMITLLSNDVEGLERAIRISEEAYVDAGGSIEDYNALQQEAARRAATAASAIARFSNVKKNLFDTLSQFFIPAFVKTVDLFSNFIDTLNTWINMNPEEANAIIKSMGVLVGTLGGSFLLTTVGLRTFLQVLGGPFTIIIATAIGLVSSLVGLLLNPAGLITGFLLFGPALAGALAMAGAFGIVLFDLKQNGEKVTTAFVILWETLKNLGTALGELVSGFFDFIGALNQTSSAVEGARSPVASFLYFISNQINAITTRARELAQAFGILAQIGRGEFVTGNAGTPRTAEEEARLNDLLRERERLQRELNRATEDGGIVYQDYRLEAGDTLYDLAQEYGTTVDAILAASDATLDDFMQGRIDIKIPVGADSTQLQSELEEINFMIDQIGGEESTLKKLEDNPIFERMFGDDAGAIERAKSAWDEIRSDADRISNAVDLIKQGFSQIFDGEFRDGFKSFGEAFKEGFGGIGGILGTVLGVASGSFASSTSGIDKTIEGVPSLVRDSLLADGGGINTDFVNEVGTFISDNLQHALLFGVTLAFGTPIGAFATFGQLFLDAIEDDFMGMGQLAEDSPIIQEILNLRNTIGDALSDVFNSFGPDPANLLQGAGMAGAGVVGPSVSSGFGERFLNSVGSSLGMIVGDLADLIGTVVTEAISRLPELIDIGLEFGKAFVEGLFATNPEDSIGTQIGEVLKRALGIGIAIIALSSGPIAMISSMLGLLFTAAFGQFGIIKMISVSIMNLIIGAAGLLTPVGLAVAAAAIIGTLFLALTDGKAREKIARAIEDLLSFTGFDLDKFREDAAGFLESIFQPVANIISGVINAVHKITAGVERVFLGMLDAFWGIMEAIDRAAGKIGVDLGGAFGDAEDQRENVRQRIRALDLEGIVQEETATLGNVIEAIVVGDATDNQTLVSAAQARLAEISGQINVNELFTGEDSPIKTALMDALLGMDDETFAVTAESMGLGSGTFNQIINDILSDGEITIDDQVKAAFARKIQDAMQLELSPEQESALGFIISEGGVEASTEEIETFMAQVWSRVDLTEDAETAGLDIADSLMNAFATQTGIESPSQVFKEYGSNIVMGLMLGLTENWPLVQPFFLMLQWNLNALTLKTMIFRNVFIGSFGAMLPTLVAFTNVWQREVKKVQSVLDALVYTLEKAGKYMGIFMDELGRANPNVGPSGAKPRAFGGPLNSGNLYEVAERNLPFELFQFGDRRFMIPNQNGTAISPLNGSSLSTGAISNNSISNIDNSRAVTVQVEIGNISGNVSPQTAQQIGQQIGNAAQNTLTDRLKRRGLV